MVLLHGVYGSASERLRASSHCSLSCSDLLSEKQKENEHDWPSSSLPALQTGMHAYTMIIQLLSCCTDPARDIFLLHCIYELLTRTSVPAHPSQMFTWCLKNWSSNSCPSSSGTYQKLNSYNWSSDSSENGKAQHCPPSQTHTHMFAQVPVWLMQPSTRVSNFFFFPNKKQERILFLTYWMVPSYFSLLFIHINNLQIRKKMHIFKAMRQQQSFVTAGRVSYQADLTY